jgi:formate-dependent nitrite reductase membrane component NrfD
MRPAVGTRGEPSSWRRQGDGVELAQAGDARWSFLFESRDSRYAAEKPDPLEIAAVNRRMRTAGVPGVHGPFVKQPVWTWEVPLYFWIGGIASGSAFVALACDLASDERSAVLARRVALGAVAPAPLLLIGDLGRPERFLNMLRVFKPRSPMNMGAWCLVAFSGTAAAAVGTDLLGRRAWARALGGATAILGGYLGSYTGVLLASTAIPLWARSRLFLGPIFVATATATGAATTRLSLVFGGMRRVHPTTDALRRLETGSILAELALSTINERRLGKAADALRGGRPGAIYRIAQAAVLLGLGAQARGRRGRPSLENVSSVLYLAGGLAFRYAWVYGGKASAAHHEAAAEMGREGPETTRATSSERMPLPASGIRRTWGEAVRRISLVLERTVRGRGAAA